jgi:hypothetical protein
MRGMGLSLTRFWLSTEVVATVVSNIVGRTSIAGRLGGVGILCGQRVLEFDVMCY